MLKLSDLKPKYGSSSRRKRVARGESSGMGKTAGRGHKGQQSRSGGGFYVGFEGGQNPLYKRVPKLRGFKNHLFRIEYAVVNLGDLHELTEKVITPDILKEKGFVRKNAAYVKILAGGAFKGTATVKAHKFSSEAQEKITKAGGTFEIIPLYGSARKTNLRKKKKA